MEFKIVPNDEVSMFMRPSDVAQKSFMVSKDTDATFAQPFPPDIRGIRRNLQAEWSQIENEEIEDLPPPSSKELVRVFLRIKPKTDEESHYYSISSQDNGSGISGEEVKTFVIDSDHQLSAFSPVDSVAYKNGNDSIHRFTFSKIFPSITEQPQIFEEIVKPRLQDFLEGLNQLIFTYGATSSGKTFTIQGDSSRPGILPRALDVLFNSVHPNNLSPDDINIKPLGYNRVSALLPREKEKVLTEKNSIIEMGNVLSQALDSSEYSNVSQVSVGSVRNRIKEENCINLKDKESLHYAIWVSFAEVYNENIYDLFEKIPEPKHKGERPRRTPLKLADDRDRVYIKGLKEVPVSNADEAYQLLLIGQKNLQFAATKLNHNSSRSHCIFTIKIVRIADKDQPKSARVSVLSFCDLAGSERIKKTLNTGERQKEAGSINTSLLVLGRCIKAIRQNQLVKDSKKHQMVPYRESKLTRLFQSYFTGSGKVSMIVNITQSPYLFDETLNALKFSAIASKVHIEQSKKTKTTIPAKNAGLEKDKRKTRFSIIMMESKKSMCPRGSIAWENPQFCSSICPPPSRPYGAIEEEDEPNLADETMQVDTKYDGLMKVINNLKNDLIEEKQKNIKLEADIRAELCDEFNKMLVEIEKSNEQRLQEEKDRASELSDWRISKLEEALKESRRRKQDSESDSDSDKELERVKDELEAIKVLHKAAQQEIISTKSELKSSAEAKAMLETKVEQLQKELVTSNDALKSQCSDAKIEELEKAIDEKEAKIVDLKSLLDEAAEEYSTKEEAVKESQSQVFSLERKNREMDIQLKESDNQIDELKDLLSEATSRAEEKELLIFEMEEKIEQLTSSKLENEEEIKWSTKMATDQQLTILNDEIEALKSEKKKMRAKLDSIEADVTSKENEVTSMEKELKSMMQLNRQNQEKMANLEKESAKLRKKAVDAETKSSDIAKTMKEKTQMIDNFQVAIETLKSELDQKKSDNEELGFKNKKLEAEVEAKDYDVKKTKDERDRLMSHYEQQLKKLAEDLNLEKRETSKLRQVMQTTTPIKQKDIGRDNEVTMLREEVAKKSELIQQLAAKVTTPKRNGEDCCAKLKSELQSLKEKHQKDLEKQGDRYTKLIDEFRNANTELQKYVEPNAAKRIMNTKRIVEDSEDENVPPSKADKSTIEATPINTSNSKKRTRSKRGKKMSATTQVSFDDDSIMSSKDNLSLTSVGEEESKSKRPRRGNRVSKNTRPSRKYSSKTNDESQDADATTEPLTDTSHRLNSVSEVQTPKAATNRKRKLFTHTPGPDAFTPDGECDEPTDTPHSIVRRQLRSRKNKIKQ